MGTLSHGRCFDVSADAYADWASRAADPSATVTLPSCTASTTVNPFDLSMADGVTVSAAVASVWIAAAVWRYLIRSLKDRQDGD